jgi:uncharacterized protein YegL
MFSFAHPFVLLLLLPLAAILVIVARSRGWDRTRSPSLSTVVMCVAPVLVVLALAGPQVRSGTQRQTVLAVDESASVSKQARAIERRWIDGTGNDDCVSPCRIVRFAGASMMTPAGVGKGSASAPDAGATDLQAAIQTAVGLVPHHGRVVVLSDGAQTQGDLLAAAPAAAGRDVRVDWVRLPATTGRDAAITAIAAPTTVRQGDPVPLTLTVHSTVSGPAVLRIRSGAGAARQQTVQLRAGDNPLLLFYTANHRGWQTFEATVSLPGDTQPKNNSLWVTTDVLAAPRVLIIGDGGSPLRAILAHAGLHATTTRPSGLPSSVSGYRGLDAVVFNDVSATQLHQAQISALSTAVRTDGVGLLVIGGPHAFSLGHYATSGLQHLLPVASLVPGNLQRRNVAIELVLDHSGSMIDEAGGVPKIVMTHVATTDSAKFIAAHKDQIGVVDFDIVAHLLVPLQRLNSTADENRVDRIVDGLQANGGTNIYLGLLEGFRQILKSSAAERHIILMTDGISQPENYNPLLARLRQEHISVATVALGSDADRTLLKQIAHGTGGHAYATNDAKQLPKIFAKETQLSAKPVRVKGRLSVSVSADSPVVRSLAGTNLPGLRGDVVTTLNPGAQADLIATNAGKRTDPALAEWQIGAGRVVTWMPGITSPWAAAWGNERALWNDAVRWAQRPPIAPALVPHPVAGKQGVLQIDLGGAGGADLLVGGITGTLTDLGGFSFHVEFAPIGPGLFQADVASFPPGVYRFSLATQGTPVQTATGEVAIPYPAEYSPATATASPLGELVAQTGGRVLRPGEESVVSVPTNSLARLLTLIALVVFCVGVVMRMAPRFRRRREPRLPPTDGAGGTPPDRLPDREKVPA